MKSKRKLLEDLCANLVVEHCSTFACVCVFPSGRQLVVRTGLSLHDAYSYARWFVSENCCDCRVVRPYNVRLKGVDGGHVLYDNVIEEFKDLPF